jgi:hypothetical protein
MSNAPGTYRVDGFRCNLLDDRIWPYTKICMYSNGHSYMAVDMILDDPGDVLLIQMYVDAHAMSPDPDLVYAKNTYLLPWEDFAAAFAPAYDFEPSRKPVRYVFA